MVVPYIEAGYRGSISLALIDEVIEVAVTDGDPRVARLLEGRRRGRAEPDEHTPIVADDARRWVARSAKNVATGRCADLPQRVAEPRLPPFKGKVARTGSCT